MQFFEQKRVTLMQRFSFKTLMIFEILKAAPNYIPPYFLTPFFSELSWHTHWIIQGLTNLRMLFANHKEDKFCQRLSLESPWYRKMITCWPFKIQVEKETVSRKWEDHLLLILTMKLRTFQFEKASEKFRWSFLQQHQKSVNEASPF